MNIECHMEYPYRDIPCETREERINRVVSIGKENLFGFGIQ